LINKLYSYFIQEILDGMVEEVVLQQAVEETVGVVEPEIGGINNFLKSKCHNSSNIKINIKLFILTRSIG